MTTPQEDDRNMLQGLEKQALEAAKSPAKLAWEPPFCGPIDICIKADGSWFYAGSPITRPSLVKLFASVLRREADEHYYLVTPVEKCSIIVEDAPFLAVQMRTQGEGKTQEIILETTLDEVITVGKQHPLRFVKEPGTDGMKPYVKIRDGLEALVSRALFYDLFALGVHEGAWFGVWSQNQFFPMLTSSELGEQPA